MGSQSTEELKRQKEELQTANWKLYVKNLVSMKAQKIKYLEDMEKMTNMTKMALISKAQVQKENYTKNG